MSESDGENLERLLVLVSGKSAESLRLMVSLWPQAAAVNGPAARLKRWADLTGLPFSEVRRLSVPLLSSGICGPGGEVDAEAAQIVRGAFASALEALEASRKGRKSGGS